MTGAKRGGGGGIRGLKVTLHERIAATIFSATQRYNIVPKLQRCVALKIFVANRPV